MSNKIGYKTEAYKNANYQVALVEKPKAETCTLEDALQQIGWEKAKILILEYLTAGQTDAHHFYGKQLSEIKKRFFEPI